ncbi:MAG: substrate-binding domain-containing protein [Paramuribaculum sp.]|nr:substrate-binding domain-containing protein [Paramuribaculum sp.]
MNTKALRYTAIAIAALAIAGCSKYKTGEYSKGSTVIACDQTFQNIMEQEILVFEHNYQGSNVMDLYVDENSAIDSLLNIDNNVRMAVASRPLSNEEIAYLRKHDRNVNQTAVAVDAIALIVNPANPIEQIDYQDVVDILTGKLTSWDQIAADDARLGDIAVIFDHNGSSTTRYMADSVLMGKPFAGNIYAQKSPQEVFEKVAASKNAIGIIGVSWLRSTLTGRELSEQELASLNDADSLTNLSEMTTDVKVLAVSPKDKVRAYLPDQQNIFDGTYPFHRQMYLISTSVPNTVGHSFYTFVTSHVGQKIILSSGICPKLISVQIVEL